jgi:hypothetical protein
MFLLRDSSLNDVLRIGLHFKDVSNSKPTQTTFTEILLRVNTPLSAWLFQLLLSSQFLNSIAL